MPKNNIVNETATLDDFIPEIPDMTKFNMGKRFMVQRRIGKGITPEQLNLIEADSKIKALAADLQARNFKFGGYTSDEIKFIHPSGAEICLTVCKNQYRAILKGNPVSDEDYSKFFNSKGVHYQQQF